MRSENDKLIEKIQEGVGFWDYLEEQIDFPFMVTYHVFYILKQIKNI